MALSDPLAVVDYDVSAEGDASSKTIYLPLTVAGDNKAAYGAPDAPIRVSVSHTYGKRTRRSIRVDFAKDAPNTWNPSQNSRYTMSVYMVIDEPVTGFTDKEVELNACTLLNLLASSGAAPGDNVFADPNLAYIVQGVS